MLAKRHSLRTLLPRESILKVWPGLEKGSEHPSLSHIIQNYNRVDNFVLAARVEIVCLVSCRGQRSKYLRLWTTKHKHPYRINRVICEHSHFCCTTGWYDLPRKTNSGALKTVKRVFALRYVNMVIGTSPALNYTESANSEKLENLHSPIWDGLATPPVWTLNPDKRRC